jgi:hypothetical protein
MSEHQPDHEDADPQEGLSPGNDAPTTPTHEKTDPEAGTAGADKRSQESQAEQEERSSTLDEPGASGGNQTR